MRFDLTDLRLFLNVHEAGTITDGARRSNMTLASASERIRGMENHLGVPLLRRERRGVRPTPAGRTLVHHARVVLAQVERMRAELGDYGAGLTGHVRLLCNTSALSEYLPDLLSSFLLRYPRISVDVEEMVSDDIADAIRMGLADIGLVSDSIDLQGLDTFAFQEDALTLIVPKAHPWAARDGISLAEVAHADFVGLGPGSALHDHVAHHARLLGKQLSYRIRLRSFDAVCRMVGMGIGIAIVPTKAAIRCGRSAGIKRVALTDSWATRTLVLCVRSGEALPLYAEQMMAYMLAGQDSR